MKTLRSLRVKMLQDELFSLYRDSHSAWQWAKDGPQHQRFAEKIDERIILLEGKLQNLLDSNQLHSV